MNSLARGLTVLQALDMRRFALTVSQVSDATEISRAASRRCLYTLEKQGFVAQNDGRYSLRPKVLTLGFAHLSSVPLARIAQPLLDRCRDQLVESCSLGVLEQPHVFYLARAQTSRILSITITIGTRLPAYCTSMGRVLLANLSNDKLEEYLAHATLQPKTSKTITSVIELRTVLASVRRAGYAIVDQELEMGLRSIAVPVYNCRGDVVASINVGTQSVRVSLNGMIRRILPQLRSAADELKHLLEKAK